MAEGRSGDSSLHDRRQEQIASDMSSSFRTSSGGGVGCKGIRGWGIVGNFILPK